MEKRIEKWESLRLDVQKFMPQEYCGCPLTITGHTITVNTSDAPFSPNIHMLLDLPKAGTGGLAWDQAGDGLWTEEDRNQNPDKPYTSDSHGVSVGDVLIYFGKGWDNGGNPGKPSNYPVDYDFASHGFTYVDAFMEVGSTNLHVYKADWTDIWSKNNS